jgi:hypothetical protein
MRVETTVEVSITRPLGGGVIKRYQTSSQTPNIGSVIAKIRCPNANVNATQKRKIEALLVSVDDLIRRLIACFRMPVCSPIRVTRP